MDCIKRTSLLICLFITTACSTSGPQVRPSGSEKTADTKNLESASKVFQSNRPVSQMDVYMVGFHPMKDHPEHQMEAHHFCKSVNEDLIQCALFDGNSKDANLNGIEYIISEKLFNSLPAEEKEYWHPHNYEILSGQLITPGLPEIAETAFLKKNMNSYGKTWHVWNTGHHGRNDAQNLPLGEAKLAWSFNHDGEALPGLEAKTEKKFGVSFQEKRKARSELVKLAKPQQGVNDLRNHFVGKKLSKIKGVEDSRQAQEE